MKKLAMIFFSLSLISYSNLAFASSLKLDPQEVNALKEIWEKLGLTGKKEWDFNKDPCSLEGKLVGIYVICDCRNSTCHVTEIYMQMVNVSTTLPTEFTKLPYLETLFLDLNYFEGTVPTKWATMRLSRLSLMGNRLSGPFPVALMKMITLKSLSIQGNHFTGQIPKEIANLKNLNHIDLASNDFTGELPVALGKLTNLTFVKLSDNNFTGKIPNFISQWTKIETLHIQGCSFNGPIPSGISVLTKLIELRISDLKGGASTFPQLDNMTQIEQLVLRNCFINGSIPNYVGYKISLRLLDLSFNNLTGEIPSSLSQLGGVNYMYLTNNSLSGPMPEWIMSSTTNVDVSYNKFTLGSSKIKNCEQRTRNVVESFSSSSTKENNNIHPCLRKDFPCTKPMAEQMYSLHINCGGEEVNINTIKYEADDHERNGASIYFCSDQNNWAFSSTGNFLDDSSESDVFIISNKSNLHNMISTSETKLYTTARRAAISLTYYGLCLMNGNYNVSLHFAEIVYIQDNSNNSLGRRVFDVYVQDELKLKDFDIAKEAGGASWAVIKRFMTDVKNNTLKVQLYWAGKGTTMIPNEGNYGPIISAISVEPNFKPPFFGKKTSVSVGLIIGVITGACIVGFLIFCWWKRDYIMVTILTYFPPAGMQCTIIDRDQGIQENIIVEEGIQENIIVYTAEEIKAATNNFDPSNKLGEGGFGPVYKGTLRENRIAAIKILSSKSKQGINEFMAEVGTISALRHPNIAKLYGLSIHEEQYTLVYEYLENNSLYHALFGTNQELKLQLTWAVRIRICTEIAQGLAYIHGQSPSVIHRDIKSSNVLLDASLTAKISDFGLACTKKDGKTHVSSSSAGTVGNIAPEYAMRNELSIAIDVYSFGVVALELFSGKRVTRKVNGSYYLVEWAYFLQETENLLQLVDPSLGSNYTSEEEALRILRVALLCVNYEAGLRPSMNEVVEALMDQTSFERLLGDPRYADNDPFTSKARTSTNTQHWSERSKSRLVIDETYTSSVAGPSKSSIDEIEEIVENNSQGSARG